MDGVYLRQLSSVEAEFESGQQPVNLLLEGLGGFTPGVGSTTVTIGYVVPIGGLEYPYLKRLHEGAYVDLQLGLGSEALAARGKILNSRISQSTGEAVSGTCTWQGEFSVPE